MGKINLSKPTFLILFLVVVGIGLTIGAASAVMVFSENLQVDNGAGDSEVEITSNTGASKLTLTDQGTKSYQMRIEDGNNKLVIFDDTKNKPRIIIKNFGGVEVKKGMVVDGNTLVVKSLNNRVGIGTTNPATSLHVVGDTTIESTLTVGLTTIDSATGNVVVGGTISGIGTVPIGTVLDWWCSADCTIPDGFVIADGQLISDSASPFDGENVPNLSDTFIRGVTNVGDVGNSGGSVDHFHTHDHSTDVTSNSASHQHTIDSLLFLQTLTDNASHDHVWSTFIPPVWRTFDGSGGPMIIMKDLGDGMHTDGAGYFPVGIDCPTPPCSIGPFFHTSEAGTSHKHTYTIPGHSTNSDGIHSHNFDLDTKDSDLKNHEPPWFGLVKIIRIK